MLMVAMIACKAWLMIVYHNNKQDTMLAPEQKHTYTVRGLNFKGLIFYDVPLFEFFIEFFIQFTDWNFFSLNLYIDTGNGIHYG